MSSFSPQIGGSALGGRPWTTQYRIRLEQSLCRLELSGLPDVSLLASSDANQRIDILTSWELSLGQRASLQGKLDHLQALVQTVLPYVRLLVSSQAKPCGGGQSPVSLQPSGQGHLLQLRSSQADTSPLELQLDDAELADLSHCLDQLLVDPRLGVKLEVDQPQPLRHHDHWRAERQTSGWVAPSAAVAALALAGLMAAVLPLPDRSNPAANPAATAGQKR
jgi:hypothetical protein